MSEVKQIQLKSIKPSPYNPRKNFEKEPLEELAQSISELGLLQPLVVYPSNGNYLLVCGERRLRAAKLAKLKEVPCVEVAPPENEAAAVQLALVENLQREDLTIAEEAPAIVALIDGGMKRSAVAKALGKSIGYVATRYGIARHPEVLAAYIDHGEENAEVYAEVGAVESLKIRKAILRAGNLRWLKDEIKAARKLEKIEDIKDRALNDFLLDYSGKNVEKCRGDWCDGKRETCQHCVELRRQSATWLGIKKPEGYYNSYMCANPDRTCLEYKLDRQRVGQEKVDKIDKKRLVDSHHTWKDGKSVNIDMADCGSKKCKGCKKLYNIPDGFRKGFSNPYAYCTDPDAACFDDKKKDYQAKVKAATKGNRYGTPRFLSVEDAAKKPDGELQALVDEQFEDFDYKDEVECRLYGDSETALEALKKRGLYPDLEIRITWKTWETPEKCDGECLFGGTPEEYCPGNCGHNKPEGEAA